MTRIANALVPIILSALLLLAAVLMAPAHTAPAMADPTEAPTGESVDIDPVVDAPADSPKPDAPEVTDPGTVAPVVVTSPETPANGIDSETGDYVGPTADDDSLAGDGAETTDPEPVTVAPEADTDTVPVDDDTDEWVPDADAVNVSITYGPNGEAESVELTDANGDPVPLGSVSESWGE